MKKVVRNYPPLCLPQLPKTTRIIMKSSLPKGLDYPSIKHTINLIISLISTLFPTVFDSPIIRFAVGNLLVFTLTPYKKSTCTPAKKRIFFLLQKPRISPPRAAPRRSRGPAPQFKKREIED